MPRGTDLAITEVRKRPHITTRAMLRTMFSVHVAVRSYETDQLGHLNQAVYASWAEHSRVELLRSAGVALPGPENLGIVVLEAHIKYLRELRTGDEVDITCAIAFREGKTFSMDSTFLRDGATVCAEVSTTMGVMDLDVRHLVKDPAGRLRALASNQDTWARAVTPDSASSAAFSRPR